MGMIRPFNIGIPPYIPQVVFAETILKKNMLVMGKWPSLKKMQCGGGKEPNALFCNFFYPEYTSFFILFEMYWLIEYPVGKISFLWLII